MSQDGRPSFVPRVRVVPSRPSRPPEREQTRGERREEEIRDECRFGAEHIRLVSLEFSTPVAITICGRCAALVETSYIDRHIEWHVSLNH